MGKTNRGKEVKGSKTSKKFSKRGVCRSSAPSPRFRPIILRACEKNNRHDSFVPVCDLTSQDLFGGKLDEVWQRVLLRVAHFVVRVKIMEYTPAHPATTGELARKRARTCTGMTTSLGEDYIIVSIPAHAVGENVEARHTVVEFFFDSDNAKDIIALKGLSLQRPLEAEPIAELTCRACPRLQKRLHSKLLSLDKSLAADDRPLEEEEVVISRETMAALVSHPHGFPKRISFGRCHGLEKLSSAENSWVSATSARTPELADHPARQAVDFAKRTLLGVFRVLAVLGRQALCPLDYRPALVRLLCSVPSCPGSSGGPIILMPPRRPNAPVTSVRVFLHVGTMPHRGLSVAVPIKRRIILSAF